MQAIPNMEAVLKLRANRSMLPVATSFIENASRACGLDEPGALALTLATEEIFSYVSCVAAPDGEIEIRCSEGGYYVDEELLFKPQDFNMRAFNLTAAVSFDDECALEETGLLIASRMVDRFRFSESEQGLRLTLRKERSYPEALDIRCPKAKPLKEFTLRSPDPEEVKILVRLVTEHYDPSFVPRRFSFPGKVVDMVACGEYSVTIAVDETGHIGGGIVWQWEGTSMVECSGPYLFNQPSEADMARELVDSCIIAIARTDALGLISRYPTPAFPVEYFERLGSVTSCSSDRPLMELEAYYRHLEEDVGGTVWTHSLLEPFLSREYERLVFAREIRPVVSEGEMPSPVSVLSAEFDRPRGRVTLRPIWWGLDAEETVKSHVELLRKENIPCIFFEIDLGKPWHAHFTPALFKNGFEPRLLLPYGGKGDLVVLQHKAGAPSP